METLQRLNLLEPGPFLALPGALQARHLGHTYNILSGGYIEPTKPNTPSGSPDGAADPEILAKIQAMREANG